MRRFYVKRRTVLLLTLALALSVASAAFAGPGVGTPAPEFTLTDVNGDYHSLSDYEGKVILLNFWASW